MLPPLNSAMASECGEGNGAEIGGEVVVLQWLAGYRWRTRSHVVLCWRRDQVRRWVCLLV